MNMERPIGRGPDGSEQDPRPLVALAPSGFGGAAIAVGCAVLAILLFLVLNQQRLAREAPPAAGREVAEISAPPPLELPPPANAGEAPAPASAGPLAGGAMPPASEPVRYYRSRALHPVVIEQWPPAPVPGSGQAPPVPEPYPQPPAYAAAPPPPPAFAGPAIVQDSGESRQWSGGGASAGEKAAAPAGEGHAAPAKASAAAYPRPIGDLSRVIAVGTMIPAVLETPVDSVRPGMTRAVVSRPVRSFDGSRVLIPRGSKLVGEIKGSGDSNHLMVEWSQLILPGGLVLDINSPGADAGGRAGLDARSHGDAGRFVGGLLQSALGIGAAVVGGRWSPLYYAVPVGGQAAQLVPRGSRKRYTVEAGAQINVVVAKILDFSPSAARS